MQASLKCGKHAVPKWIGWAMSVLALIILEVRLTLSHPLPWAPLPIFLAGARMTSTVTVRLSLRQGGRTRVEALVEGGGTFEFIQIQMPHERLRYE